MRYYVYTLAYPESMGGKVFYVGKGSRSRIKNHLVEARRGDISPKCDIIRQIWKSGRNVVETKVAEFDDEQQAYQFETELINTIGKENLTNLADGGQGGARPGAGRPREYITIKRMASFSLNLEERNGNRGILIGGVRWYNTKEIQAVAQYIERHKAWLQGNE